jgi:AraC-like DNA-binding protein
MPRSAKFISICANASPRKPNSNSEVSFAEVRSATCLFHVLCAANLTSLRLWNNSHVFDPFWRIYYNFTPGAYIEHDRKYTRLGPNHLVIVPANVLFETFLKAASVNHFYLHFTVGSTHVFPSNQPIVLPADSSAKRLVSGLAKSLNQDKPDRTFDYQRCLSLLHYLFASVLAKASFRAIDRPEIAKVLRKLNEDPRAFSTVAEMAAFAGMSNRNFQRRFQRAIGKTPLLYLNEARLREAARRLINSDHTIDEVAFELGFANRFHFSRLFRHFLGTPPAAFRRRRL